jgi:hypothetical protein
VDLGKGFLAAFEQNASLHASSFVRGFVRGDSFEFERYHMHAAQRPGKRALSGHCERH